MSFDTVFETFEHAGCTIELHYDYDPQSPADWDTLGTLYAFSPDYQGMEKADENAREMMERRGVAGMLRYLSLSGVQAIPFDLFDYGSGGVTIREAGATDDDCDGYIAATPKTIEMTGVTDVPVGLRAELAEWRAYFAGEVIGYVVHRGTFPMPDDGVIVTGEDARYVASLPVVGSCWGFYPETPADGKDEYEYVRQEARTEAEAEETAVRDALARGIPTVGE